MIDDTDLSHLNRCVELAQLALDEGDQPFGSLIISQDGRVLFEDRNRISGGDHTQHPEFAIARWAANNLSESDRKHAVVYTSGEHCAMCSAAHGWVGLGRIVYASSTEQFTQWQNELGAPAGPVRALSINEVIPDTPVDGPAEALTERIRAMHVAYHHRHA
ncbi:nucleoside deaminase [Caballeronia sp. BR00000012568055]|uniref:nucleoside deaminase n=1 Tax=Caballeronia sp. BR00000012568055 TaxID=2918761 RepID=UPI0023F81F89|nr:nucleoside deaminase [Caballeronia sp. BR00000012568055]